MVVLADPSAPSMGSTNTITSSVSDNNMDHSSISMTQSPVTTHDTSSYVPSPTTSTGYGYHNTSLPMPARSVSGISEDQQAVSPKPAYAQQQRRPHSPQQQEYHPPQPPQIMKPPQQSALDLSPPPQVVIQQCKDTCSSYFQVLTFFFFFTNSPSRR